MKDTFLVSITVELNRLPDGQVIVDDLEVNESGWGESTIEDDVVPEYFTDYTKDMLPGSVMWVKCEWHGRWENEPCGECEPYYWIENAEVVEDDEYMDDATRYVFGAM